jgi:two-component system sensor histidine kinase PilS (NtrC family)
MAATTIPRDSINAAQSWRTLEYYALIRVLVASGLLLSLVALGAPFSWRSTSGDQNLPLILACSVAYFILTGTQALAAFYVRRSFVLQVGGQLSVDLVIVTLLMVFTGGFRGGMMILFLLPLAGGALLLPMTAALSVCSVAVLALLGDGLLRTLQQEAPESSLFQAGWFGAAMLAITALLSLLAQRLTTQEQLAALRGRDLHNQLEINRLVIAQMEQGVVVLDAGTRVRANNRSARVLLGVGADAQLTGRRLSDIAHLEALSLAFSEWISQSDSDGSWSDSVLAPLPATGESTRTMRELQLRVRFARPATPSSDEYVIFVEDIRVYEERAQQLKLAAMGRLTASIAHEIRNPLAAISHAGELLDEAPTSTLQKRLVGIVRENTNRLNRLVEDVLRVARREAPLGDEFELGPFLREWLGEFEHDRDLVAGAVHLDAQDGLSVKFEQGHLRQVLFNLVDNALRYASKGQHSVRILAERATSAAHGIELWVFDDGPGVAPEVRSALFEPFFTTHSRGTGLGLYLAREFCAANGAELALATRRLSGNEVREGFVLRFTQGAGGSLDQLAGLDTMSAS